MNLSSSESFYLTVRVPGGDLYLCGKWSRACEHETRKKESSSSHESPNSYSSPLSALYSFPTTNFEHASKLLSYKS